MQPVVLTKIEDVRTTVPQKRSPDGAEKEQAPNTDASTTSKHEEVGNGDDDQWQDSNSLYEEFLDDTEAFAYPAGQSFCTAQAAKQYRQRLHEIGLEEFVEETLVKGEVSVKTLCAAFGVRIPSWLQGESDEASYRLLGLAMLRELKKRQRIPGYENIDDAAKLLKTSENILVITGAGISTSLGIPDFRSKSTGFYTKLQAMGYHEPEEVFDLDTFDVDATTFYTLAGEILPDLDRWTPTHQFIRMIQDKGKLLRNYTQNIDNIESHAGIQSAKLIQCHGSWATATCRKCKHQVSGENIFEDVKAKRVAHCKKCIAELNAERPGMKRKRSSNGAHKSKKRSSGTDDDSDGQYDIPQPGVMKPDITFFGEDLPDKFFDALQNEDRLRVDLIIVIGTSMKVAPVSEIPQFVPASVPQIYISRDPIHHINFDINLLGDSDRVVAELCKRAGWDLKHEMLPTNEIINVEKHEVLENTYTVKAPKVEPTV
ncbi:SIR2-domain-containing protein [Tothia fuscella]|uniref:SIR2-domain-containing protein n=1 Tax=Tothia fuscella TaxID=1048955 RepID=A0A9P4NSK3_9PEZI|nr:SIR2-domain-containing protein [Tothia fuscella]